VFRNVLQKNKARNWSTFGKSAKALGKHEGFLSLNSLTTLSDEAAKALAEFDGCSLELWGLTKLSRKALASLQENEKIVLPDEFKR
jgi:hypothetical protein